MSFTLLVFSGFWFWLSSILFLFYSLVFSTCWFQILFQVGIFIFKLPKFQHIHLQIAKNFNIFIFKFPKNSICIHIFTYIHIQIGKKINICIFKLPKNLTYSSSHWQNFDIFIFRANNLAQRSSALNCGLCSVWEVLRLLFFFFFLIYNFREFFSFLKLSSP